MGNLSSDDLLYPLSYFCGTRNGQMSPPEVLSIPARSLPPEERWLLAHDADMTSRLATFYESLIGLRVLHHELDHDRLRREVVLTALDLPDAQPIEYGAIEINLDSFEPAQRERILANENPFGALLKHFGIQHYSRPRAFLEVSMAASTFQQLHLGTGDPREKLYGRSNELFRHDGVLLATIIEILAPVNMSQRNAFQERISQLPI